MMNPPVDFLKNFQNPEAVARYREGPPRFVPGFWDLHRMTSILLAERAPENARVLVLGAGGGLELEALATDHPDWLFDGVDPAAEMLALAERQLGALNERVRLHCGYIEDAPEGAFDAAVCLLTLHFLAEEERISTLQEVRRRLKPGAAFVAAHGSIPCDSKDTKAKDLWLSRYAAFAVASGVEPEMADNARAAVRANVNMMTPQEDEGAMRRAGFSHVEQFYSAFTWRGWVATA